MTGEFGLIERIRKLLPAPPAGETWAGDDAAVVAAPRGGLILTCDAVVAGVHADLSLVGLDDFGWKAVASALSDVAAMGGQPRYLLVTVGGPPETDV
ncbi:MAG: AIR synthase related protein, partial [Acidimicrobiales bacterium]